ncbi:MAG: hypothetical protein LQ338_005480 [Usnochroma carphineum]|nr:MAG: hypothetical protein LQ338_005480 [Usnochroma carphineum]
MAGNLIAGASDSGLAFETQALLEPSIPSEPWRLRTYNAKERWYAKPLVYTPPGQKQLVFTASNQNWIRTVDAVTGAPMNARQVQPPFLQSELGCGDMPDYIGIVGTPVIDPNTNTAYFFAKGYQDNAASGGVAKGIYKYAVKHYLKTAGLTDTLRFYAVNILDLTDRPGFPVLIDGHNADNDPARYFIGGTILQRPSVTLIDGIVYGAFGGHCDLFNYTGMVTGVSTTAGVGVTSMFAMESSPGAPPVDLNIMDQKGGKAGIWMSGMAPATDGGRLFVVTGNGQGHENKDTPASGRSPLSTLDEVVANLAVSKGKLTLQDYFEPYEYIGMDAGDRDLGSGGVALLDPSVFKGTNGVSRIAVTIGKNGKAYIMNADNLGGFRLGPGATDNILQTIIAPNTVFGGAGSYPLEGGYIYFTPVGTATLAYKLGLDQNGSPLFSKVGQSTDSSGGGVGVGVPTVTTYKGQPGTGIVWVTDVDGGLKAYKAVPDSSGNLVKMNIPPTGGLNKFQRPAFGDGRLYVTDNNNRLICMGSPVSIPLNCTSPVDFGGVTIGSAKTVTVNCTALIPITNINGLTIQDATFQANNASLPAKSLAQGATFSFPVIWNLTQASIHDAIGASFGSVSPGVKTSSLVITTTNGVAQYSNQLPITLQGSEVSSAPFLSLSPPEVDFGGLVVGSPGAATGLDSAFIIANIGSSPLVILGYAYTNTDSDDADGGASYTNTTQVKDGTKISEACTSSDLPAVGSVVAPGQSLTVPINFNAGEVGNYQSVFNIWTSGGNKYVLLTGSATTAPIAKLEVETGEGGWDGSGVMDFGTVQAGTTVTRRLRICNIGGSALLITKSKPPIDAELRAENPTSDLHEGQSIPQGECAYAPIDIAAAPEAPNNPFHDVSDVWILNTDDLTFGVHDVQIKATIISRQLGPAYANGTARYSYLGCYSDINPRQLQNSFDLGTSNENGICQTRCQGLGYRFAGTEYHTQCWCGNNPPSSVKYTPCCAMWRRFVLVDFLSLFYVLSILNVSVDHGLYSLHLILRNVDNNHNVFSFNPVLDSFEFDPRSHIENIDHHNKYLLPDDQLVNVVCIPNYQPEHVDNSHVFLHVFKGIAYLNPPAGKAVDTYAFRYANDSMTIGICLDWCKSKRTTYAGIEYHRECYCGNSIANDAVANVAGCTSTCMGNTMEICGGSNRMNVYQAISSASSSTTSTAKSSSTSTSSATSSTSSSFSISFLSSSITTSKPSSVTNTSSSPSTTTSKPSSTTIISSTTSSNTTSTISSTISPSTINISSTSSLSRTTTTSRSSATAASSSSSRSTSKPSSTTSATFSTTSKPSSTFATTTRSLTTSYATPNPSTTASPTKGFYSLGCYAEPPSPTQKPMTQLLSSNMMSPDVCISAMSAANKPGTTYAVFGLEYGSECWAATGLVQNQTRIVGDQACTLQCAGATGVSCGGRGLYNYYVATSFSGSLSVTGQPVRTSGTVRASVTAR